MNNLWSKVWPVLLYGVVIALLAVLLVPLFTTREPAEGLAGPVAAEAAPWQLRIVEPVVLLSGEHDVIRMAYEVPAAQDMVAAFFDRITGSRELSDVILTSAAIFNIPVSLAFALCSEESGFDPKAVNRANRNHSVDRGLFQLNSSSFPRLTEEEFFNPAINSYYGMAHLRYCLDSAGTEVAGLAMYNAGPNRVKTGGTPKVTLDYISRIIKLRNQIDAQFLVEYLEPVMQALSEEEIAASSLSLLMPRG